MDVGELTFETASKFSDSLNTLSAYESGRHQHGQLLQREVGEGPDGSGHPSDWQGGWAPRDAQSGEVHCIVKGMLRGNFLYHRQNTKHHPAGKGSTAESTVSPAGLFLVSS